MYNYLCTIKDPSMLFDPENHIVQLCAKGMKYEGRRSALVLALLLFASCHSPEGKAPATTPDTTLEAHDTNKPVTAAPEDHPKKAIPLKTHLKDTTYIAGNVLLFLRPDDARYKELNDDPDNEVGEGDSDFGVSISNTQDSVAKNDKYKTIKVLVSTRRYISIKDCINCPLVIDRDSTDYGYILSGKGKKIDSSYNSVHSGHYLGEIDNYFFTVK